MKVALTFFGITRSLKYTIKSIETNILDALKENTIEYDIFLHTYNLKTYTNIRTGENATTVDNEEYKLLNPTYLHIEDQDEVKQLLQLQLYRTHKDPWNTEYNSVDNFILAQFSKARCVQMIQKTGIQYDYIIWLRPDVLYAHKFSINFLKLVNDKTVCVPNFSLFGKYKFNDRFCISNMKTYTLYGDIFSKLLEISKKQELHSETILGEYMHKNNILVKKILFNFSRVRCNGQIIDTFT